MKSRSYLSKMVTRNGIWYKMENSPWECTIDGINYRFSSQLHRDKFQALYLKTRDSVNASLSARFGIEFKLRYLSDIVLYNKLETRGFHVVTEKGEVIKWLDQVQFDGVRLTLKDSLKT